MSMFTGKVNKPSAIRKLMWTLHVFKIITINDYRTALNKLPVVARWG